MAQARVILPLLTPHPSEDPVFPRLSELELFSFWGERVKETKKLCNALRRFISARRGSITRLKVPPLQNMEITGFLRQNVPHLEVCID